MRSLQGASALVTGAASGIGRAIALHLAQAGARLWLLDVNEAELAKTAEATRSLGAVVVAETCDLSDPAAITASINRLRETWGVLDLLVNNAGVALYASTPAMKIEQWRRIMAINLHAPVQLIHETLPLLLSRTPQHPEAHILNMGSFLGLIPYRRAAAYQATKYAIVGLSQTLRAELADTDVGVTVLCPGFVRDTNLFNSVDRPEEKYRDKAPSRWICGTADKVARRAIRAIRRNHGLVVMTPLARLVWWWSRLTPWMIDWIYQLNGWAKKRRRKRKAARSAKV